MKRMIGIGLAAAAAALLVGPAMGAGTNLVVNGGLEGADAKTGLPSGWDSVVIGNPATIAPDKTVKHGGEQSVRVSAMDTARAYARSSAVQVAAGERLKVSVWVKYKDVPVRNGGVIAIADFFGPDGRLAEYLKVDAAKREGTDSDWQHLEGTVTAPANAATMRLRLGFSYLQGTCWWDDVTVESETPASLRIDFPTPRVTPADPWLPLTFLNRAGAKGAGRVKVTVGKETGTFDVKLTGEQVQKINVPFPLGRQGQVAQDGSKAQSAGENYPPVKPKKIPIEAALVVAGKEVAVARMEGEVPPALVLPPVSPTHWCVEDGAARITGRIELDCPPDWVDRSVMTLAVKRAGGEAGRAIITRSWSAEERTLHTGAPATVFDLSLPLVPAGDYVVSVDFAGPEGRLHAHQPWHVIPRRLAEVTLSKAGYPVYDGRAFYPIGIFNGAKFVEQGKAGFTVTHAYNATRVFPGRDPGDQAAMDYLDQSEANHMKMLFMVPLKLAEEGDWDGFRRRIRLFRNHPGLLAWDEEEGLARGDWKPETRAKAYAIVHEEDPHHPFMVGDSRDIITRMGDRSNFFDNATMDLGMWWWYPFPLAARGGNALEGEEASKGAVLEPPAFLVKRNTDKPVWVGVQAYKKPGAGSRYPTVAEYRLQAWYGIVTGAQGLMYYGGSVTGGMFLKPEESHWAELQKIVGEVHSVEEFLLTPTVKKIDPLSEKQPVAIAVKKAGGRTLVIAVNRGPDTIEVTLPELGVEGTAEVAGEGRRVSFMPGATREHFDPYSVHLYLIRG